MKHFLYTFLTVTTGVILVVFFTNLLVFANGQGQTITVTATVRPLRLIVVDNNLVIMQIISNTSEEIRPMVVLNTVDGEEIPYSESIITQYQGLKPSLNFSKPGILYERIDQPFQAAFNRVGRIVSKLMQSPF